MSDANSLLPCPFCGSANVSADEILGISDGKTFSQAQCLDCLATGPETPCDTCDPGGELAAGTWNRRASPVSTGADAKDAAPQGEMPERELLREIFEWWTGSFSAILQNGMQDSSWSDWDHEQAKKGAEFAIRMGCLVGDPVAIRVKGAMSDEAGAKDAARLGWLDSKTIPFNMGWKLGLAPRGNLGGIMLLGNCKATVREAIDAAMSDEAGKV